MNIATFIVLSYPNPPYEESSTIVESNTTIPIMIMIRMKAVLLLRVEFKKKDSFRLKL